MPRGITKGSSKIGSFQSAIAKDLTSTLTGAVYKVEDLDMSIEENHDIIEENELKDRKGVITMVFGPDTPPSKPTTSRLIRRISTIFEIPIPKKYHLTFYPPMPKSKTAHHVISSSSMVEEKNFMYRILCVIGSVELFDLSDSPVIGAFIGSKKIYLKSGYGVKFNVGPANLVSLRYDDRDCYDNKQYPGRGIKNPEKRWLIVLDIFGETSSDAEQVSAKEAEKLLNSSSHVMEMFQKLQKDPEAIGQLLGGDLTSPEVINSLQEKLLPKSEVVSIASDLDQVESPTEVVPDPVTYTFAMVKPGSFDKADIILAELKEAGFGVHTSVSQTLTRELAKGLYQEHAEQPFFDRLIDYTTSGPLVSMILTLPASSGKSAWQAWRELMGPTSVEKAKVEAPNSLRARFSGEKNPADNAVHGSDSSEAAIREVALMFPGIKL